MRTINKAELLKRPAKWSQNAKHVIISYQFPVQLWKDWWEVYKLLTKG